MLRPLLATAIIVLAFASGALAIYFQAHKEELTPIGRRHVLVSFVGLLWTGLPLGAAYAVVAYAPPGNHWRRWWYVTAGWTCFFAGVGLFALAYKWLLLPLVGEPISTLVYFGVGGVCTHLLIKRAQRPRK